MVEEEVGEETGLADDEFVDADVPEHYGGAGTVIAEVEATDRDSGIFGQVS